MAPLAVCGSTSNRFQFWLTLRLMISTYQPKRLPKSPFVMLTGELAEPGWAMVERGRMEPACSPNWARLSGWGWCCWVLRAFSGLSFSCLPEKGMAVSSTACLALGVGSAGAWLGVSVERTLLLGGWSEGSGMALETRLTWMAPPAPGLPHGLRWRKPLRKP